MICVVVRACRDRIFSFQFFFSFDLCSPCVHADRIE